LAELVFVLSVGLVAYVYAGYPLLLLHWSRRRPRGVAKRGIEPEVSLVVAAHNERERIAEKARSCLDLDYPRDKLQILVSLDGPTDGTEAVLHHPEFLEVEQVHLPAHRGKAAALNVAVARARGEIVVFTDTRQRLDPSAIRRLVENFGDATVGAVSGKLVLDDDPQQASEGVGLYWRYERRIRALEGQVHSVVGATGALYAVRRKLYRPLPEDLVLDDVAVPMAVVLSGRRVVYEEGAIAYDRLSDEIGGEYRRKVRTLAGNFQLMALMPELLDPRRNPIFTQFLSHKAGRLLVPYLMLLAAGSSLFLEGSFKAAAVSAEAAFAAFCFAGFLVSRFDFLRRFRTRRGLVSLPLRGFLFAWTFLAMNGAAVAGLYHFLAARSDLIGKLWSAKRRPKRASEWV
jgi:cellulose synthase/poly-beta-1,6-N-acetylglucosamine synthase-like glycosyltransferase